MAGLLFFVFGSLASGKSTVLRGLQAKRTALIAIEPDIPRPATTKADRQRQLQQRLLRISNEFGDSDFLYAGQSPLGELLACPIATSFTGIAPCLLDCSDPVRISRLRSRGWQSRIPEVEVLGWAQWMRQHAMDPQHEQDVLLEGGATELYWERWTNWRSGDPRWQVTVIDNTDEEPTETLERLLGWMVAQGQRIATNKLPLGVGWERRSPRAMSHKLEDRTD